MAVEFQKLLDAIEHVARWGPIMEREPGHCQRDLSDIIEAYEEFKAKHGR